MATYDMDEGRMVVPEGWEDRTLNSLEYAVEDDVIKVVVSRNPHQDKKLAARIDDTLADMRRRLAAFELLERTDTEVDGEPAVLVDLKFKDGAVRSQQRSLWFHVGRKCVTVGVIHRSSREELPGAAQAARIFQQIRDSIAIRDPETDAVPAGDPPDGTQEPL